MIPHPHGVSQVFNLKRPRSQERQSATSISRRSKLPDSRLSQGKWVCSRRSWRWPFALGNRVPEQRFPTDPYAPKHPEHHQCLHGIKERVAAGDGRGRFHGKLRSANHAMAFRKHTKDSTAATRRQISASAWRFCSQVRYGEAATANREGSSNPRKRPRCSRRGGASPVVFRHADSCFPSFNSGEEPAMLSTSG